MDYKELKKKREEELEAGRKTAKVMSIALPIIIGVGILLVLYADPFIMLIVFLLVCGVLGLTGHLF